MIFWIMIAVVAAATVYFLWLNVWSKGSYLYDRSDKIFYSLIGVVLGACVALVLMLIIYGIAADNLDKPEVYSSSDTDLVALETRDSASGELHAGIFASYGSIDGERVLSYISKDSSGAMQLGQLSADKTYVYEGDYKPHITTQKWVAGSKFFWPWELASGEVYSVYVPKGSVTQNFNVAP